MGTTPHSLDSSADRSSAFLSTLSADKRHWRMAGAAVCVSFLIFLAIAPFARTALPPVAAFIPVYQTALVTNDLITAVLLMGQYSFLRSRALLVLGAGYLFCAFMAVAHALSFPGLFAPSGVLGAGPQTTAWLYFLWHGGFPLFVLAYVWLKERGAAESAAKETAQATGAARSGIVLAASGALALTVVLVLLTTVGHDALPVLMRGNQDDTGKLRVAFFTWTLSLVALVCLWRKARSVLDLWLMVTLVAWLLVRVTSQWHRLRSSSWAPRHAVAWALHVTPCRQRTSTRPPKSLTTIQHVTSNVMALTCASWVIRLMVLNSNQASLLATSL